MRDPYGLLELLDENFLITSHLAYLTEDSIQQMSMLAIDSVIRLLSGKSGKYTVNPDYLHYKHQ